MLFDFCFNCHLEDNSFSYSDWANVLIAFFNVCLVIYIFRHQRKIEKELRVINERASVRQYRQNWFKEIIIIPRFSRIHSHFIELEVLVMTLERNSEMSIRDVIHEKIKTELRSYSKDFIELLYPIDHEFADRLQLMSDVFLEQLQKQLYMERELNRFVLIDQLKTYRNQSIETIYSFEPKS